MLTDALRFWVDVYLSTKWRPHCNILAGARQLKSSRSKVVYYVYSRRGCCLSSTLLQVSELLGTWENMQLFAYIEHSKQNISGRTERTGFMKHNSGIVKIATASNTAVTYNCLHWSTLFFLSYGLVWTITHLASKNFTLYKSVYRSQRNCILHIVIRLCIRGR